MNRCPSLRNYSLESYHKALGKSKQWYSSLPGKVKGNIEKEFLQIFWITKYKWHYNELDCVCFGCITLRLFKNNFLELLAYDLGEDLTYALYCTVDDISIVSL